MLLLVTLFVSVVLDSVLSEGFVNANKVRKRNIVRTKSGLFHHEGPYMSHEQNAREIRQKKEESIFSVTRTPRNSPYTYSVTGSFVTPATPFKMSPSPYYQSSTPVPAIYSTPSYQTPQPYSPSFHYMTPVPGYSPYPTPKSYSGSTIHKHSIIPKYSIMSTVSSCRNDGNQYSKPE